MYPTSKSNRIIRSYPGYRLFESADAVERVLVFELVGRTLKSRFIEGTFNRWFLPLLIGFVASGNTLIGFICLVCIFLRPDDPMTLWDIGWREKLVPACYIVSPDYIVIHPDLKAKLVDMLGYMPHVYESDVWHPSLSRSVMEGRATKW